MGKTIQGLMIEESSLMQVVNVITEGLKTAEVSEQVRKELEHWCDGMREHHYRMQALEEMAADAQELGLGY